ncbi:centromere protein H [Prosthecochloris sp. SCSIO W1102]|uniref:hypothetical protein n=1 Tax=Prosthecochloris sp. SCSIO W1102 TaxID=2992243 RepID=UPI00223DB467|nr:hypothetical protein [Prosthecochloris sp. SCSIO W1102]UZJ39989.1 centromere protein H [Prosthecochloris sp. SCSIO W1102]
MDLISLQAVFAGISQAIKDTKSIVKAEGAFEEKGKRADVLSQLVDIQEKLLDLKERIFELQEENHELKTKLAEIDEWEEKKEDYELIKTEAGEHVYRSKNQPVHFACPKCFEEKHVYILHDERCPNCNNYFSIEKQDSIGGDPADSFGGWMGV